MIEEKPLKLLRKENIGFGLLLVSMIISLIFCMNSSIIEITLSDVAYEYRVWFFVWGVFTSLGIYINSRIMAEKLEFINKWFDILLFISSVSLLIVVSILGEPIWMKVIHKTFSIVFGVLGFTCVMWLFIIHHQKLLKTNSFTKIPYLTILTGAAIIDIVSIFQYGLTIFCELFIIIVCEIMILTLLYVEKIKLVNKELVDIFS